MTDNEIIKALECCFARGFDESTCYECPFYTATAQCTEDLRDSALDLINRQKAENERLKKEVEDKERAYNDEFCLRKEWQTKCRESLKEKQTAKSEAIKEFAHFVIDKSRNGVIYASDIPDLVKEMMEVNENE